MPYQYTGYTYLLIIFLLTFINCNAFSYSFIPEPPTLTTNNFILMDYNSGQILLEKNSEKRLEPASLTKIMTMYIVDSEIKAGRITLEEGVTISKKAWQSIGSRMFLDVNSKVKIKDLIKGIIIQSGNDASIAIAEHIAGSEMSFVALMNEYADILGMHNSNFVNTTGLPDPDHYSTAKDLAILVKAIIKEHPGSYQIYSQKSFIYNNIEQYNRNKLLWRNSIVDGVKTGQTESAGFCLAASGVKDNNRLIAIILGAKTDEIRTIDANKLLVWGFRFFTSHQIYQKDKILQTARVWGGNNKTINIGLADDTYISLVKSNINKLTTNLNIPKLIKAPIQQGDVIGSYTVKLKDQTIAEYPAIVLNTVKKGNFFSRLIDQIIMYGHIVIDDL